MEIIYKIKSNQELLSELITALQYWEDNARSMKDNPSAIIVHPKIYHYIDMQYYNIGIFRNPDEIRELTLNGAKVKLYSSYEMPEDELRVY